MGRTEEGRSELVELADDSASSTDATIPSSPRGARSMTGRRSVPLCLERGEAVDVGTGMRESECKTPERTLSTHLHRSFSWCWCCYAAAVAAAQLLLCSSTAADDDTSG